MKPGVRLFNMSVTIPVLFSGSAYNAISSSKSDLRTIVKIACQIGRSDGDPHTKVFRQDPIDAPVVELGSGSNGITCINP